MVFTCCNLGFLEGANWVLCILVVEGEGEGGVWGGIELGGLKVEEGGRGT